MIKMAMIDRPGFHLASVYSVFLPGAFFVPFMICLIVTVVYLAFFLCRNIRVLNSRSSYGKVLSYDL